MHMGQYKTNNKFKGKDIIVDDFIGGRKGQNLVRELIDSSQNPLPNTIRLDTDIRISPLKNPQIVNSEQIQEEILKKLIGKEYDLMLFIETGGVYILACNEILKHGKKHANLLLSRHNVTVEDRSNKQIVSDSCIERKVNQLSPLIESSEKIAILEGDVGKRGDTLKKLKLIKEVILEINKDTEIDFVIGISVEKNYFLKTIFEALDNCTVGFIVNKFEKLSDIADLFLSKKEISHEKLSPVQEKLVEAWKKRRILSIEKYK